MLESLEVGDAFRDNEFPFASVRCQQLKNC